jgi:hypothetical protein
MYIREQERVDKSQKPQKLNYSIKSNIFTPKNWDFLAEKPPKNSTTGVLSNIQLPKGSVT